MQLGVVTANSIASEMAQPSDLSIAAARILGIIRLGFAEVEITEYEETIIPLKAGPIKIPGIQFGTVNLGHDYTPEWKIDPLPPIQPLE